MQFMEISQYYLRSNIYFDAFLIWQKYDYKREDNI